MSPSLSSNIILPILLTVQFLIYLDRGIIPGSIEELNSFITTTLGTSHPDVYLGVLQSSFVIGLSISCPIIAHYSHSVSPYSLISVGIGIWMAGAWMAGLSYHIGLYSVLLIGRILSGVGEAALISLVPPLIMKKAEGPAVGLWMGSFCAMIPIGTAAGYCYGSILAGSIEGWGTAFILEAVVGVPFVLIFLGISSFSSSPISSQSDDASSSVASSSAISLASSVISDTEQQRLEDVEEERTEQSSTVPIASYNSVVLNRDLNNKEDGAAASSGSSSNDPSSTGEPRETRNASVSVDGDDERNQSSSSQLNSRITDHHPQYREYLSHSKVTGYLVETPKGGKHPRLTGAASIRSDQCERDRHCRRGNSLEERLTAISPAGRYVSFTKGTGCLSIHSDEDDTTNGSRAVMTLSRRTSLQHGNLSGRTNIDGIDSHHHLSFFDDFKAVIASPSFVWLAVGYSAYSAAVIAFSTFGSAFLVDLGLLSNETLASMSMGATVAISGIIGGLAGGGLASIAAKKRDNSVSIEEQEIDEDAFGSGLQQLNDGGDDGWPEIVDGRDSSHHDVLIPLHPMNEHEDECEQMRNDVQLKAAEIHRFIELSDLLDTMFPVLMASILILCLASFAQTLSSFLIVVGAGLSGLFSTQAGLNIATMLSVPESQRTCSIAMITLILHLAGDVPSPIIVGLLKDVLAPDCASTDPPLLGFTPSVFALHSNSTRTNSTVPVYPQLSLPHQNLTNPSPPNVIPPHTNITSIVTNGILHQTWPHGSAHLLNHDFIQAGYTALRATERRLAASYSALETPSAACRDESFGIRITIFLTTIWLGWMVIGVVKAKQSAAQSLDTLRSSTNLLDNKGRIENPSEQSVQ